MQANEATIKDLCTVLHATLDVRTATRQAAEKHLTSVEKNAGYGVVLLAVVANPAIDVNLKMVSSVTFKNLVSRYWAYDMEDGPPPVIPVVDRDLIKKELVALMCSAPRTIQPTLSEALTIISKSDWPTHWPTLMPELVSKLADPSMDVVNGVLETTNSVFKRFRGAEGNKANCDDLKVGLDHFQVPLLEMFTKFAAAVGANKDNKAVLEPLFKALRTMARIFYSLNWITIPEFFEDNLKPWMKMFTEFLGYKNPLLDDPDEEEQSGPIERLQAAILENIAIYAEKYDEEMREFFPTVVSAVWGLVTGWGDRGRQAKYDLIIASALKFLSGVVDKDLHKAVFEKPETLANICNNAAVPNMVVRDVEEELFEDNPVEYIRRDIEGSDSDTRRRAAVDLIRGLCQTFDEQVTAICLASCQSMMGNYAANPAEWKQKDAALTLLLALAVRSETRAKGVTAVNPRVNVAEIVKTQVAPELAAPDVNDRPILKATCLKFLFTFRNQMEGPLLEGLLPHLARLLESRHYVVHTYAAYAVERLVHVRVAGSAGLRPDVVGASFAAVVGQLFKIMRTEGYPENDYLMRCAMRVVAHGGSAVLPLAKDILDNTAAILFKVAANPSHPTFNHYVFETLAALLRTVTTASPSADTVNVFETLLFPPFQKILSAGVGEFLPYCFQVFAQLLDLRPLPAPGAKEIVLSDAYKGLFTPLMSPQLWGEKGNVPALVRLLDSYLRRACSQVVTAENVPALLGIFHKLLTLRATEAQAVTLLTSIVLHVPLPLYQDKLPDVFRLLGERLKRPTFQRSFIRATTMMAAKLGPEIVGAALDRIAPGTFMGLLKGVLVPNLATATGALARKTTAIGMIRVLTETPSLVETDLELFKAGLGAVVEVFEKGSGGGMAAAASAGAGAGAAADDEPAAEVEYSAGYSRLSFANQKQTDPFPEIPEPRAYLAHQLATLSARHVGKVGPLVATMPPVQRYISMAGVAVN